MPRSKSPKAPKCPKCRKHLSTLVYASTRICFGTLRPDGYREDDITEDETEVEFLCPQCAEKLFTNECAALDFLDGSK